MAARREFVERSAIFFGLLAQRSVKQISDFFYMPRQKILIIKSIFDQNYFINCSISLLRHIVVDGKTSEDIHFIAKKEKVAMKAAVYEGLKTRTPREVYRFLKMQKTFVSKVADTIHYNNEHHTDWEEHLKCTVFKMCHFHKTKKHILDTMTGRRPSCVL